MPEERLSMRKIKEVLRLKLDLALSHRQIARSCSIAHSSVLRYLRRAEQAGLRWPLPGDLDDSALENLLFPPPLNVPSSQRPVPDFNSIHEDLKKHRHLTLHFVWEEYKQSYPEGYQYSRFCELYHQWAKKLDLVLRQEHRAGEKLFVDHAGPTVPIVSPDTGEVSDASIFVAVLGVSNYTFAEATFKRDLPAWIGSHVHALEYLGGCPAVIVPDNWKTGVHRACYYEPDLNPTYRDFAEHYGTVIIPARPGKARDKAKVEAGVLLVERWILAALRHRTFFSLAELNGAIRELLVTLNNRKFRKLDTTRAQLFETLDRPALNPLPAEPFVYAEWKKAKPGIDYHIEIDRHYYSVPYQLVGQEVEARISANTVEVFYKGRRLATHVRSFIPGKHTTLPEHMPKSHRKHLEWNPARIIHWAESVGSSTATLVQNIMESRPHPEHGFRSCLGILRLGKRYSEQRLEAACARAVQVKTYSYKSVKSILETGLDRQPLEPETAVEGHSVWHINVRGAAYYQGKGAANAS
jgi:transposase